jgi:hypothetical protein
MCDNTAPVQHSTWQTSGPAVESIWSEKALCVWFAKVMTKYLNVDLQYRKGDIIFFVMQPVPEPGRRIHISAPGGV